MTFLGDTAVTVEGLHVANAELSSYQGLFYGSCNDLENQFHFQSRQSFPAWTEKFKCDIFLWSWAFS